MTATELFPGLPDPEARPEFYDGVPMKRGLAWLIDAAVIGVLTALAVLLSAFIAAFFLPLTVLVISFLYRWVTITGRSATLGMRVMSVEFRTRYGERFDSGTALLHTLGYTVSVAVFPAQLVSIALMLITERGQGLTDHFLGTTAVNR
ncbi:RDD family protein [Ovoidimarina sediminis]|uniref:RDD family protein n=1 Tax=Ovoidimarina sediminis TaxID=3079856 RepID=UPI0029128B39|nr:RDD family protein [Rhodophyticola sp. MJ-SS7]MDU8945350.1 RDD family protein [Rhodophyticola sp. MJ-SS7]